MKSILLSFFFFILSQTFVFAQNATFVITTNGTTPAVDAAIDHATQIWSQYIQSNIPIKIHVNYVQIPGFLGVSLANSVKNFPNAPQQDIWYPTCLANAISNVELNPGETDMEIAISATANWYFGVDGNPGSNQQDFVSVFLHEVCHSLGIVSVANVKDGEGSFGLVSPLDLGISPATFTFDELEGLPGIFDYYLINGAGDYLTDPTEYTNESAELANQLTSGNLFFSGDSAKLAYNGFPPRIYAPPTFALGSSCSHFDELTFNGTDNKLMTPFNTAGEIQHTPGPIVLGTLYDVGWNQYDHPPTAISTQKNEANAVVLSPNPFDEATSWHFSLENTATFQVKVFNAQGQMVFKTAAMQLPSGNHQIAWEANGQASGIYTYQMRIQDQLKTGFIIKH